MIDIAPLSRHSKIALSFSGGKDSLACVYLLRAHLDRITLYHMDTGDLLPEMTSVVDHVRSFAPNFVHIQGDIDDAITRDGLPTDLLPHSAHNVGQQMGEGARLVSRYDCCFKNLMWPTFSRMRDDGNTLIIRGTKAADMKRLPVRDGETHDGIEYWYPLQYWSHTEVLDYLRSVGAPISRVYDTVTNAPECAKCSAWWGEKRATYLERYHPALWREYSSRMRVVLGEISPMLRNLHAEVAGLAPEPIGMLGTLEVAA